uniref:HAUS augmin like complex subunit 6 n=1 Tax=Anser brachyrhynchus TaxID=132585 RepID=A0A8B9BHR0_9AVES
MDINNRAGAVGSNWERTHLWLCLLALGFDPDAAAEFFGRELDLGVSMFDTPNVGAFHVVAQFLFTKLDEMRAEEVFRDCMLPEQITRDSEFRKQCCSWLKDITNESKSCLPQIATSSFLSPAGHKFIHLMYRFARYVMIENLRKNSVGSDTSFAEAVNLTPECMYKAEVRCSVACNKLLQILQKEDIIIREYNKKSQFLIKEIKQIKSEYAYHQQQLFNKHFNVVFLSFLPIKVRNMWTFVMDTLTSLKKETEIVDSVIEGHVDQYTLAGTNVNVPQLLADKVESEMHEVCTGNLYEGEKLNFLTVIQLLNEALRILRDECCQFKSKHFQDIKNTSEFQNKILSNLKAVRISSESLNLSEASESSDTLIEKVILQNKEVTILFSRNLRFSNILQVAKTVTSESPQSGGGEGITLEDLISSLTFNPFLTRQQIPRTPENLLTEIRSSWRKAIQTDNSSDTELAPAEVMTEEAPMDASPTVWNKADPTLVWSTSSSPVPDFDSPLLETKSQLSCTEFTAQNQMRINNISGCPVWETSGVQENESDKEQELEHTVLSRSFVQKTEESTCLDVENSINTLDVFSESNSKINTVPSNQLWDSLVDRILQWDAPSVLSSDNCEVAEAGILHETLPKDFDSIDANKSTSSESDFDVLNSKDVPGSTKIKDFAQKSNLDVQSQFSRYEMLKKTASGNREKLHQTDTGDESVSYISDLNLRPEKERDDFCSTLDLFRLDEEFTRTPSPLSFPKGNHSLSPLLVFSQDLEEMASRIHKIPLDLMHKLKDEEQLNEKLGSKEPSSG